ncbi:MAG: peptidoglycan-associated lipoprotein [Proteobacteria bacterium]|nr:MAG: peptidoglycan-associated lipoprotein [Pseudomonadota bacterium]
MKKVLVSLSILSVLFLSGCSQKNPDIDGSNMSLGGGGNVNSIDTSTGLSGGGNDVSSVSEFISRTKSQLKPVYFAFDRFDIVSSMRNVVANDAQILKSQRVSNLTIKLEGNCDEFGTDEYNMALGLKRAQSVKRALISQGISSSKIQTITYGKNNPVCSEKSASCRARNRRVDFDLLP